MTKTITISRANLKAKRFKEVTVKQSGAAPPKRDVDLLVVVLKKALAQ